MEYNNTKIELLTNTKIELLIISSNIIMPYPKRRSPIPTEKARIRI